MKTEKGLGAGSFTLFLLSTSTTTKPPEITKYNYQVRFDPPSRSQKMKGHRPV